MIPAALTLALALQAAPPAKGPESFDLGKQVRAASVSKLAEAMDRGFDSCGRQIATRTYLTSGNAAQLKRNGLELGGTPPAEVAAAAATVFKQSPIYAQVTGAAASIWLVGSATIPICRVIVADTSEVPAARKALADRFAASRSWSSDQAQSRTSNGVVRQAYVLGKNRPGPRLLTFIDGPAETTDGGKGIQAIITVGLSKAQTAGSAKTDKK